MLSPTSVTKEHLSVREQCQLGAADQRLYCYLFCCVVFCVQELSAPR
jgi:hypothetical protein